jgi:type I restriction enzyme M protein
MNTELENKLWKAADQLRANAKFKSSEYFYPIMGLIFLKYANEKFEETTKKLHEKYGKSTRLTKDHYLAQGAFYLPETSKYTYLLSIPSGEKLGLAINDAMRAIEADNPALKDTLPKIYTKLENDFLQNFLRIFEELKLDKDDHIGRVYEYFLGEFASSEGKKGGEFFTPRSIVRLIVEIMEPYSGRIFDPACGSGGMFVQSADFVDNHRKNGKSSAELLSIYGQEKTEETVKLAKLNLAVHGLEGDIRSANSYYVDEFKSVEFDYIMANPPFNVNGIDKEKIKDDKRYSLGLPSGDNGNYIWISMFLTKLGSSGKAGFVMANSAADAGGSEKEIRRKIIERGAVDCIVSVGSNFFYTVTLPCTLWFFDRGKAKIDSKTLFIDARNIFTQIDRAHREFTPAQIEFIGNIARLAKGKSPEYAGGSKEITAEHFPDGRYSDIPGLCKLADIKEIEAQGWSLNPGRFVGVTAREDDGFDFKTRLEELNEELEILNAQARSLEDTISENVSKLLEGYNE